MPAAAPELSARIRCGIAGWSYPDWEGFVYPRGVKDKLRYVAEYVDMLEVNSTFYRPPAPGMAASWHARTADLPDFFFSAKLHQDITHRGRLDPAMVTAFRRGLAPLREAGRLRHLLAQFRYDYADTPESRAHLERIAAAFRELAPLAVEVRHGSWQAPEALAFLRGLDAAVVHLDYPRGRDSFDAYLCPPAEHAYFRLHGRNAAAWFDAAAGRDETYNYCYSGAELAGIVERAAAIAGLSKTLTLVANNHFQGKELVNTLELKAMLTRAKVRVPPGLADRYPQLKGVEAAAPGAPPVQGELWA